VYYLYAPNSTGQADLATHYPRRAEPPRPIPPEQKWGTSRALKLDWLRTILAPDDARLTRFEGLIRSPNPASGTSW